MMFMEYHMICSDEIENRESEKYIFVLIDSTVQYSTVQTTSYVIRRMYTTLACQIHSTVSTGVGVVALTYMLSIVY